MPPAECHVLVVTWAGSHGRSEAIARALQAERLFMPWAEAHGPLLHSVAGWMRSGRATWRRVRQLPDDSVVIVICPPVFAVAVAVVAAGPNRHVVVDAHSGAFNDVRWRWSHPLLRRLLRRVDLVLVTNEEVARGFLPPGRPAVVLHDPLRPPRTTVQEPLPPGVQRPYVVFPAGGAPDEPLEALLGAARLLAGDPLVVVTGGGQAWMAGDGLRATGYLPDAPYNALLAGAEAVLALTTREDTMQRAAYEALEVDLPLVCSNTALLRHEYGDAAVYCDPTPDSIAAAVRAAVKGDQSKRTRAAADVRQGIESLANDAVARIHGLSAVASAAPQSQPLVSVVIDNYNYEQFVPLAVDSALKQTYERVEVVVVDDGSRDGSVEVLRAYGDRITLVCKENGGQASAINAGFAASTGEVVLFLDADDELYPTAVARVVEQLGPGTAKVHFRLDSIDGDGRPLGFTNPTQRAPLASGDASRTLVRTGRYVTPVMSGNAYPRAVLEKILPVPEQDFRISADGYLVALAALHGRVAAIEESLGAYRIHGRNAWAVDAMDGGALRARLEHDLARYRAVTAEAVRCGLAPMGDLGVRDQSHLRARLASCRLAPELHPLPTDRRPRLVLRGVTDACTAPGLSPRQRAAAVLWFPVVGFAPLPLASRAVAWLYVPQQRLGWNSVRPLGRRRPVSSLRGEGSFGKAANSLSSGPP